MFICIFNKKTKSRFIHCIVFFFLVLADLSCTTASKGQLNNVQPNDILPDSKAIQQLINKAVEGEQLFFPAGTYLIDAPINISKKGLIVSGDSTTIFKFTNSTDFYKLYKTRVGMLNIFADNVTVKNIYFDQNFRGSGRKDGDAPMIGCILIGGKYLGPAVTTKNISILNCTIYDYYGDAISVFNAKTNNLTISGNTIISAYIAGKWTEADVKGEQAINVASGNNIKINKNNIQGALDDAIAIHTASLDVTIIDNIITTTGGRILVNGVTNGIVSGNVIRYIQNGGSAIQISFEHEGAKFSSNKNVLISNNKIYIEKGIRITSGIRLFGPGDSIAIVNNVIESANKQAIGIELRDRYFQKEKFNYFGDNIIIKNNHIKNFAVGISKNLSYKVRAPKLDVMDNDIQNADRVFEEK